MVTIDIAPKLKFMEGGAFRPWLIPVGLDIHVISPPSNQTQYLDVGVQFGGRVPNGKCGRPSSWAWMHAIT